jgi:hypothetical protein
MLTGKYVLTGKSYHIEQNRKGAATSISQRNFEQT